MYFVIVYDMKYDKMINTGNRGIFVPFSTFKYFLIFKNFYNVYAF